MFCTERAHNAFLGDIKSFSKYMHLCGTAGTLGPNVEILISRKALSDIQMFHKSFQKRIFCFFVKQLVFKFSSFKSTYLVPVGRTVSSAEAELLQLTFDICALSCLSCIANLPSEFASTSSNERNSNHRHSVVSHHQNIGRTLNIVVMHLLSFLSHHRHYGGTCTW